MDSNSQLIQHYREELERNQRQIQKADHYATEALELYTNAKSDYEKWTSTLRSEEERGDLLISTLVALGVPEEDLY